MDVDMKTWLRIWKLGFTCVRKYAEMGVYCAEIGEVELENLIHSIYW
jgi:hypothetical protein